MNRRILLENDPFAGRAGLEKGAWPVRWIGAPNPPAPPFAVAFRLQFSLETEQTARVHVSADERYELFLNGERIGRGPERGDVEHWPFESYDLALKAGKNTLVARVSCLGDAAPFAQFSLRHGFLLAPDAPELLEMLGTGHAHWEANILGGIEWGNALLGWTGANLIVNGAKFSWNHHLGAGQGWGKAVFLHEGATWERDGMRPVHRLQPARLPAMRDEVWTRGKIELVANLESLPTHEIPLRASDNLPAELAQWQRFLGGERLEIPPRTKRRVLLDLEDYLCAYPQIEVSGGRDSLVRIHWQEALYCEREARTKGHRDKWDGKFFVTCWHLKDGVGDIFLPDGGQNRLFETLWWQCGRWVEIVVETRDEPLVLERLTLCETRYPLELESRFGSSDARLEAITPVMLRGLQMCAHETWMDCPFFEQLMYSGDTRLESLTGFVVAKDARLARRALELFADSRLPSNLTQSRYPSRGRQWIPPFSLWWVAMLHDYALWRGDLAFIKTLLPVARGVVDVVAAHLDERGLMRAQSGWNFTDWVMEKPWAAPEDKGKGIFWKAGTPPDGQTGFSGILNWQAALVLGQMADLESWCDEPELASRARRLSQTIGEASTRAFWNEERGLFADDLEHKHWSEHAQCLAILSGQLAPEKLARLEKSLLQTPNLTRATIYFSHYLFEALRVLNRADAIWPRLDLWFDLPARGLKTTVEMPEPTRSDCHAWGAHPLFHFHATFAGIRPVAPGFSQVEIKPQFGPLDFVRVTMPHPRGEISLDLRRNGDEVCGEVTLPDGVSGNLVWNAQNLHLKSGTQKISS